MPKIIFINRFFYPDHSATSQMLSDIAFGLAGMGWRVTVITSRVFYHGSGGPLPPRESIGNVEIRRTWTSSFGRHHLAGRAVDYATFYLSAALAALRTARRGDILIAKTDPPMLSALIGPVAWWRGAILVNWLQDVFPEVAQVLGMRFGPASSGVFRTLRALRDRSLKQAAANVVLGARMSAYLAMLGVLEKRIRVIGNFADGDKVRPISGSNSVRAEWRLGDKFVVGYSGNLGRAHEYQTMLAAIQLTGPDVAWVFVGGGAQFGKLQREVESRGLTNVHFKPYQPDDRLAESLSAADAHIVSLLPELEGLIVPSKFYGICAAGRPTIFIGDGDGEIARLVRRKGCGVTVEVGDGEGLARTIAALAADPEEGRSMGARARAAFIAEFDKSIAIEHWQRLLREVAEHDAPIRAPTSPPAPE